MTEFGELPMLVAMICASMCVLFDSCRTASNVTCAVVMVIGMVDAAYLHILPLAADAGAIAVTGVWVGVIGLRGSGADHAGLHVYRVVSAVAMALLLRHHVEAMQIPSDEMAGMVMPDMSPQPDFLSVYTVLGAILLLAGIAVTAKTLRVQSPRQGRFLKHITAYEPLLMGVALLLMTRP